MDSHSIDVLDIVNQDRYKFGLRESDFRRYRVHCTNKLKTLRKSIGLQHVHHKTKKFGRRSFDLDAIHKNAHLHRKYFLISLFQVEHSWASSREIREQIQLVLKKSRQLRSNESSSTGVSRLRKHSHNRLAKAFQHTGQLVDLCHVTSNPLAVDTLAQVYVHRLYMKGLLDFELARWESSLDHFVVSFVILRALGNSPSANQNGGHKKRVVFYQSMDELSPMIRYCGYKLGLDSFEIDTFSQERFDQARLSLEAIKEAHWNQIKSFIDSSKEFDQPVVELTFIKKLISIRTPELIDLTTQVKKADQILLSNLETPSMLDSTNPSTEKNQLKALNKKQRRRLFLQSKNPKRSNSKDLMISLTAGFDRALAIYTEAENALQGLMEANNRALESNSTIQRFDEQSKLLSTIHEIVGFRLLSTRVQRNLGLIEKIENKLIKQEVKIEGRIKRNPKNYQNINKLVMVYKNNNLESNKIIHKSNKSNPQVVDMELIKSLLIKRRQAKLFPSLLKLIEDILFNLERIKQLKLIEDDDLLSLKIESKVFFFKAYRCFIQSKSYLLIEKFLESYALQQKSYFYVRQTMKNIDETEQEENEMEEEEEEEEETTDLNSDFMKFDRTRLTFLSDEIQEKLKREITKEWIKSKEGEENRISGREELEQAQSELNKLSLIDNNNNVKFDATVFDLAFNYVTQFDWDKLGDGRSHVSSQPRVNKEPSSSSLPLDPSPTPTPDPAETPAPVKKSGGLWSFFTRS